MDRRNALKGLGLSLGYVVATPTLISMLQSCKTEVDVWTPVFFTVDEGIIIKNLVDLILPKTESAPGALDVNIPEFLDVYILEVYKDSDQKEFKAGINGIMKVLNASNKNVSRIKKEAYDSLLANYLRASKTKLEGFKENEDDTLVLNTLSKLRATSIWAYKTSEKIGEEVLVYLPVPGKFEGCISLEESTEGKAWSL